MEKEHKPRKHRFKKAYTIHIMSDDPDSEGHRYHFTPGVSQALIIGAFLALLFIVCYIIYSAISLHALYRYQATTATLTQELQEQNAQLAATNNALQNEVTQLSRAFNQKLEAEHAAEVEAHALTIPSGFPLSGAAAMEESSYGTEETPMLKFEGIEVGSAVIASGSGTVIEVSRDASYGYRIVVTHNDGYESIYLNGGVPIVSIGDEVAFGESLFRIGQGNTVLGYQVRLNGAFIDPQDMLEING